MNLFKKFFSKGCACRWIGEEQVAFCSLHAAHKEAIHDWAGRAKSSVSHNRYNHALDIIESLLNSYGCHTPKWEEARKLMDEERPIVPKVEKP